MRKKRARAGNNHLHVHEEAVSNCKGQEDYNKFEKEVADNDNIVSPCSSNLNCLIEAVT